jgi:predicted ATP-grasp superfamily ATP-dependent carboligase
LHEQYRAAARVVSPADLMVQEIIPGDGRTQFSVAAFCRDGCVLVAMTARRTRQYPIDFGLSSSFVEAIEVPELHGLARTVIGRLRLSGMVEVEVKWDRRDGRYKLLDVNVRPWGWHRLCAASGIDFPYLQYCEALGRPLPNAMARYGLRWRRLITDLPAAMQEIRAGIITPWAYARSLIGPTVGSVSDVRDPLPVLGDTAVALARWCRLAKRRRDSSTPPQAFEAVASPSLESAGLSVLIQPPVPRPLSKRR